MRHTNRRAGGVGLCKRELHRRSAAGTWRNPRGSTSLGFVEANGIHFVYVMEDMSKAAVVTAEGMTTAVGNSYELILLLPYPLLIY